MKTTRYFDSTRMRADRIGITDDWIQRVMDHPDREFVQSDARLRRWAVIAEAGDRVLRVVLLEDGITVHNAFFDRRYIP